MKTEILHNLKKANQTITRFVSELTSAEPLDRPALAVARLKNVTAQITSVERLLPGLPSATVRGQDLVTEIKMYEVNLGLFKKTMEELQPVLENEKRLVGKSLNRLGAARDWSQLLKDI